MIAAAFLRSYLPEGSLPRYPAHSGATSAFMRGDEHFLWNEPVTDDAYSVAWANETYVCPRHSRLRMLEGVLAFSNAFPNAGLIPEPELVSASTRLEQLRTVSGSMRSYILTSPWHVPIRWFAAFLHDERELYHRDGVMSLRYRTSLGDAQDRVERAVQVVDGAGLDESIVGQIRALESWLQAFPADGMLELDYASVGEQFSEGDLVLDESAADTAASLLALEQGNYDEAGMFYGNIVRRWGRFQALAFAN